MTAQVTINPLLTTNAAGSFNVESTGYVQGTALNDPAVRFQLASGILNSLETLPMWGGVGIYEFVSGSTAGYVGNPGGPRGNQGGLVGRATTVTGGSYPITGFSVIDQANAMLISPQSNAPLAPSGGQVNFYRLGTNARIAVKADPTLAGLQGTALITAAVGWDLVNQQLIPYYGATSISTATYNSTSGILTLTFASGFSPLLSPGDSVTIASVTGTGNSYVNGVQMVLTNPSPGTTVTIQLATSLSISGLSSGTLTTGTALPVKLLDVNVGNSMVVSYASGTGFATWVRTGTCAIIEI